MLEWYININSTIEELVAVLQKRGGRVDRYYLLTPNRNKKALVHLNGWIGGKNVRDALMKALTAEQI